MSNIIRPNFGKPPSTPSVKAQQAVMVRALHVFGEAAGYRVCLGHDELNAEGKVYKVVVGRATDTIVEAVALLPDTKRGKSDAVMVGLAILRALQVIEADEEGEL